MGNFDLESGKRFIQEGDLVEGIRCLLASLDLDPADPEAYVELYKAYEQAWRESGDGLVLDQMRKVAIAGLKRRPAADQRRLLEEGLDRVEEEIAAAQAEEDENERRESARRRLPVIQDDETGGAGGGDSGR